MPKFRKKIFFLIDTLNVGGAERQMTYLLRLLEQDRFIPVLYVIYPSGYYISQIPDHVKIYYPTKVGNSSRISILTIIVYLIKIFSEVCKLIRLERPDILYGNLWGPNTLLCLAWRMNPRRNRPKLVLSVVNNPDYYPFYKRILLKLFYPWADCVISCASGLREYLINNTRISDDHITVIHNAVNIDLVKQNSKEQVDHPWFKLDQPVLICVAHLLPQKGYYYLINAFEKVNKRVNCRMIIIGEGRNASLLKKQAKQIGVNEKIDFLGVQKNSNKYVAHSTIFVLASLWEGLATVLLEAAVVGTPIVATNAPFGTEDVIEDGVSGYLVPVADVNALSARIVDVLQDPNIRKKFAKNAFDRIQASFSDKVMVNKYQDVFKEITHSTKVLSDQDDLNINEIDLHPFVQ